MSNKAALLVLSALAFTSEKVEDAFDNVEKSELQESEATFKKFVDEIVEGFEDESKQNTSYVYSVFRKYFPLGEKSSEIALLPLLGNFAEMLGRQRASSFESLLEKLAGITNE